jgi:hypothetical protein
MLLESETEYQDLSELSRRFVDQDTYTTINNITHNWKFTGYLVPM